MKLYSTRNAVFTLDPDPAPVPPPLLMDAVIDERLYFERFAKFVWDNKTATTLVKAIYDKFVDELVVHDPDHPDKPLPDGARCPLDAMPAHTLAQVIVNRYEDILASAPADAIDFQLFMYIGLYHFVVWYCVDYATTYDSGERFLDEPYRTYVRDYLAYRHPGTIPADWDISEHLGEAFSTSRPVLKNHPRPLLELFDKVPRRVRNDVLRDFRDAARKIVEADLDGLVHLLVRTGVADADQVLVKQFGDLSLYGLGDGSTTKLFFGIDDYGLLFVNYSHDSEWIERLQKQQPLELGVVLRKTDSADTLTIFFLGLDKTYAKEMDPYVQLTGCALNGGEPFVKTLCGRAKTPTGHELDPPLSFITCADLENAPAIKATLSTNPKEIDTPEEIVYIVFRHGIALPSEPYRTTFSLKGELSYDNNKFRTTDDTVITQKVATTSDEQAQLHDLVLRLAERADVKVYVDALGWGIGATSEDDSTAPAGSKVTRAGSQQDNKIPDTAAPGNERLRYSYGTVDYVETPRQAYLCISTQGFASPLRCTWEKYMALASVLRSTLGVYLPQSQADGPSYNCALSAFRAFDMIEALVRRILIEAEATFSNDQVKLQQVQTTLDILTKPDTYALIKWPGGDRFAQSGDPPQPIRIIQAIVHTFTIP